MTSSASADSEAISRAIRPSRQRASRWRQAHHLGQVGRDQQDREPPLHEPMQQREHLVAGRRRPPRGSARPRMRDLRRTLQPLPHGDLLLVPAGEGRDALIGPGAPDAEARHGAVDDRASEATVDERPPVPLPGPGQGQVEPDPLVEEEPLALAVLGDEGEARVEGVRRAANRHLAPPQLDPAGGRGVDAEERPGQRRAARPRSGRPSPGSRRIGVPATRRGPRARAGRSPARRPGRGDAAASGSDPAMSRPTIHRISSAGSNPDAARVADRPAVAEHRHPVGDPADLLQTVRDVDDADALPSQRPEAIVQGPRLVIRERGGRLVEDQGPGLPGQRAGDLDQLPPCDGQAARRGPARRRVPACRGRREVLRRRPPSSGGRAAPNGSAPGPGPGSRRS